METQEERDITYFAESGQQLDFYVPKVPHSSPPMPILIFIHGGAWVRNLFL